MIHDQVPQAPQRMQTVGLRLFRISRAKSTNQFCESVRGNAKGAAAPEWMGFLENSSREWHVHLRMPDWARSDSSS
jgi:hypothetical protein